MGDIKIGKIITNNDRMFTHSSQIPTPLPHYSQISNCRYKHLKLHILLNMNLVCSLESLKCTILAPLLSVQLPHSSQIPDAVAPLLPNPRWRLLIRYRSATWLAAISALWRRINELQYRGEINNWCAFMHR